LVLVKQEIRDSFFEMWDDAPMAMPVIHCDIRPFEKSTHFMVCSAAKKTHLTGIQTDLSVTPLFQNAL
jgi:hypothetical protein